MNADGSEPTRLTTSPEGELHPTWSPDGRHIAFVSTRDGGKHEIYVMAADGSGQTRLTNRVGPDERPSWARRDPPPQLTLPAALIVPATGLDGAVLEYTASVADPTDPDVAAACSPASGTRFPMGATQVQCTASDAAWNTTSGTFTVTVRNAVEQLADIARDLETLVTENPGTPLADKAEDGLAKVQAARQKLSANPLYRTEPITELEGAAGDLEAAVASGLLAPAEGNALVDRVANAARLLTEEAIALGVARGDDPERIAEAEQRLAQGDATRADGQFKNAVAAYATACGTAEDGGEAPAQLAFTVQPPSAVEGDTSMPVVRVTIQDAFGERVRRATQAVTITLAANPAGATLSGATTVRAVNGIATFADLRVDQFADGLTLGATAAGLTDATSRPFRVHVTFAVVEAGTRMSCGITTRGLGYCWGDNFWGSLGSGLGGEGANPREPLLWPRPLPVAGRLVFTIITSGRGSSSHVCGVTAGGAGYCWGLGGEGQRGDGTRTELANTPRAVLGGFTYATLDAGGLHTCGVTTSGGAYCWGYNAVGGLGDGTTTNRTTPVPVAGGLTFATVDAGGFHSCGVTTRGAAYCWGWNPFGQLGDGTTTGSAVPVAVAGGLTFTTISAAATHTCGLTHDGAAYCWGANGFGQLGDGSVPPAPPPAPAPVERTPVPVAGNPRFATLDVDVGNDAGSQGYSCGVTTGGEAYCWGDNANGQLGDGTRVSRRAPVRVTGGLTFAKVSTGATHTCGVTTSGETYCWGSNNRGELGNGTQSPSLTPALVASGSPSMTAMREVP